MPAKYNAVAEIKSKSDSQVEKETCEKWAKRCIACYTLASSSNGDDMLEYLARGNLYYDEALEHAAMVGDHGRTVKVIQTKIEKAAKRLGCRARGTGFICGKGR